MCVLGYVYPVNEKGQGLDEVTKSIRGTKSYISTACILGKDNFDSYLLVRSFLYLKRTPYQIAIHRLEFITPKRKQVHNTPTSFSALPPPSPIDTGEDRWGVEMKRE